MVYLSIFDNKGLMAMVYLSILRVWNTWLTERLCAGTGKLSAKPRKKFEPLAVQPAALRRGCGKTSSEGRIRQWMD
jgi:hypothetical protein